MTADLEKLVGEIEEHHAGRDTCNPYDRAHHEATLQHLMLDNAPAIAAALRKVSALREALNAVMAEEMIYTGAITETLEASEMYPALVAKIRAALATGEKP